MPAHRHRLFITHVAPDNDPATQALNGGAKWPSPSSPNTGATGRFDPSPRRPAAPVFTHQRAARAPGVLLIHGQPGTASIWTRLDPMLREHGLEVRLALSGRTDGDGPAPADAPASDRAANASTLRRLLQHQRGAPEVVVGHGFGAAIAVALAANAPRRTRALVLVAPALGPTAIGAVDRLLAARGLGPTLAWLGFRGAGLVLRQPWLRRRLLVDRSRLSPEQAGELARSLRDAAAWRSFAVEQRCLVHDARQFQRLLGEIRCPTFVIAGRHDRIARWPAVCSLAGRIPESRLIATDAGHLIPIEDPTAVLNAVLRAHGRPPLTVDPDPTRSPS